MLDDEEALEVLTKQLNEWWEEREDIPDEMLRARIFLLLKNGSTWNIDSYRPIALLNTTTKIFAHILKVRIAEKIDKHLHNTQFGFRKRQKHKPRITNSKKTHRRGGKEKEWHQTNHAQSGHAFTFR